MNPITATFNGEIITIIQINANGSDIYIVYLDAAGNLKKETITSRDREVLIATNGALIP